MKERTKKWLKFGLRWGVALAGIWYVVSNISLVNRVLVSGSNGRPTPAALTAPAQESDQYFPVEWYSGTETQHTVKREELFVRADRDRANIREDDGSVLAVEVLGLKVGADPDRARWPLVVAKPRNIFMRYLGKDHGDLVRIVDPSRVVGDYSVRVPYPIIDVGLGPMTREAMSNGPWLLLAAILVFPITYLLTSVRWKMLLHVLEINMNLGRVFVINMVGAFYNTFMPGSTGGDVLKAYYAAKQTSLRTRAVLSVIIDRVLGLLALVLLGGSMAAVQYFQSPPGDPIAHRCLQVAIGSAAIIAITIIGVVVFYTPRLRRITGLDFVLGRLPMQTQVVKSVHAMELYRRHPARILTALLMSLPVHATVVLATMLAGKAFGLPISAGYYWVAVPVIVLSGSIPISPQGAGVMEFFAILLLRPQGATISHAFALTMSIRLISILWNLSGGLFVLRGGYHSPTEREKHDLESDLPQDGVERVTNAPRN